ncbi:hypothetical protein MRB53_017389 [Persea americana]|uniref:Uncharacterized protein n=1 Tax=Persea americana TaxID=3435 RepID=A0ACC2M4Z9_PERAE|nr:hypothetical protein MRB53_017389 [Persea americana]
MCLDLSICDAIIEGDSFIIWNNIHSDSGMPWKLMPLWKYLRHTLAQIPRCKVLLIPRTANRMADALAKLAPVQEIVFTSTLPIHIQDIYSYDMCLQEEENLNPEVPSRASILEEHSPDVLRRRNGEQPHIAFAGTSDQNVIALIFQRSSTLVIQFLTLEVSVAFTPPPWPYGISYFHMSTGRESDGRLLIDFIDLTTMLRSIRGDAQILRSKAADASTARQMLFTSFQSILSSTSHIKDSCYTSKLQEKSFSRSIRHGPFEVAVVLTISVTKESEAVNFENVVSHCLFVDKVVCFNSFGETMFIFKCNRYE